MGTKDSPWVLCAELGWRLDMASCVIQSHSLMCTICCSTPFTPVLAMGSEDIETATWFPARSSQPLRMASAVLFFYYSVKRDTQRLLQTNTHSTHSSSKLAIIFCVLYYPLGQRDECVREWIHATHSQQCTRSNRLQHHTKPAYTHIVHVLFYSLRVKKKQS